MSKQSQIKACFKVKTADEMEVEELLFSQASRASRATTLEKARSISSIISTRIISIIDLSNDTTNNIESLVDYASDSDSDDNDNGNPKFTEDFNNSDGTGGVEYLAGVTRNSSSVGDVIFDSLISPSAIPVTFVTHEPAFKNLKRYRSNRPKNWKLVAQYYKENRHVNGTLQHFQLGQDKVYRNNAYWVTTLGRWVKVLDDVKKNLSYKRVACYGEKIDLQLKDIVVR